MRPRTKALFLLILIIVAIIYLFGISAVGSILSKWQVILMSVGGISIWKFFIKR
jgi:hypothetical protein